MIIKEINNWIKRQLTTLGKITVIKSILLPKLTHLFITLPTPIKECLKQLEQTFFQFIWNGKNNKISRALLIQKYTDGGLQMVHLDSYIKSLKLSWFRRILQSKANLLSTLYSVITRSIISKLLQLGSDYPKKTSQIVSATYFGKKL